MNKLILSLGIALWAVCAQAQLSHRLDNPTKQAQLRIEGTKVSLDSIVAVGSKKNIFSYNANGDYTLRIDFSWNSNTKKWNASNKYELSYDTIGNDSQITVNSYTWDSQTSLWFNSSRAENDYNSNSKITRRITIRQKSNAQWENANKVEYTYDGDGNLITTQFHGWNNVTNEWTNQSKIEDSFNNKGNNITSTHYFWNSPGKWIIFSKDENSYDSNGNKILALDYHWNSSTSQWELRSKEEKVYDNNGNNTKYTSYTWNINTLQWEDVSKYENVFDTFILSSSLATLYRTKDFFNKIISKTEYSWSNGNWSTPINNIFYYSDIITGTQETELLHINKKLIRILTPLGQELQPEQATEGLFIYQYSDGSTRKVMKQ